IAKPAVKNLYGKSHFFDILAPILIESQILTLIIVLTSSNGKITHVCTLTAATDAVTKSTRIRVKSYSELLPLTNRKSDLRGSRHEPTTSGPNNNKYKYVCASCNKPYVYKGSLDRHVSNECNNPTKYACTACKRSYKYKRDLTRHLTHECGKEKTLICDICQFSTKRKVCMVIHMESWHTANEEGKTKYDCDKGRKAHVCAACGRKYMHRETLRRHVRHECGIKPRFQCNLCTISYKRKEDLHKHVAVKHHN
ncbi:zinc finger protein Gfi-1b-like, partial [Phymastichus coffea]|uniref:zinc finger protein Gfi-1b-like n=1 Tax=Phymastichus coffea TaxID=108790 RepID=UPI00273C02C0